MTDQAQGGRSSGPLRLSIVSTLVLLSLQACTGDFDVFVTTPPTPVQQSLSGFIGAYALYFITLWYTK